MGSKGKAVAVAPFDYPDVWFMPPFFTIQPVEDTKQRQLQMWTDLLIKYARHYNKATIAVDNDEGKSQGPPLFQNDEINRKRKQ
jgi:ESCRT-II complex subunit VPS25